MLKNILEPYKDKHNNWYPTIPNVYADPSCKTRCSEFELNLMTKWRHRVPQGWYGFSLGEPFPYEWYDIIDKTLDYLENLYQEKKLDIFEIHQIKLKFGGLRFGVSCAGGDEQLLKEIKQHRDDLEHYLFDEKLIY